MGKKYHLTVPGRFDSLAQIADFINQLARQAGFSEDDVFKVQMAVDEACSNVVEHAYGAGHPGEIKLSCCLEPGDEFIVTIQDNGQPFDPGGVPDPPLGVDLEDLPEGGLGLYFMRNLMDDVRFEFVQGQGNTLTMIKRAKIE